MVERSWSWSGKQPRQFSEKVTTFVRKAARRRRTAAVGYDILRILLCFLTFCINLSCHSRERERERERISAEKKIHRSLTSGEDL